MPVKPFDFAGARAAGFSDDAIASELNSRYQGLINVQGAYQAGHSLEDIDAEATRRAAARDQPDAPGAPAGMKFSTAPTDAGTSTQAFDAKTGPQGSVDPAGWQNFKDATLGAFTEPAKRLMHPIQSSKASPIGYAQPVVDAANLGLMAVGTVAAPEVTIPTLLASGAYHGSGAAQAVSDAANKAGGAMAEKGGLAGAVAGTVLGTAADAGPDMFIAHKVGQAVKAAPGAPAAEPLEFPTAERRQAEIESVIGKNSGLPGGPASADELAALKARVTANPTLQKAASQPASVEVPGPHATTEGQPGMAEMLSRLNQAQPETPVQPPSVRPPSFADQVAPGGEAEAKPASQGVAIQAPQDIIKAPPSGPVGETQVGQADGGASKEVVAKGLLDSVAAKSDPVTAGPAIEKQAQAAGQTTLTHLAGDFTGTKDVLNLPEVGSTLQGVGGFISRWTDPSNVIPKAANQVGRILDYMNAAKKPFMAETSDAIRGLNQESLEKLAYALDTDGGMDAVHAKGIKFSTQEAAAYGRVRNVLNKLADLEGMAPEARISDYFPHIWDQKGGMFFPADDLKLAPSINRFHLAREGGKGYSYDLPSVMQARINVGVRKAYMNPMVEDLNARATRMPEYTRQYAEAYGQVLLGRPRPLTQVLDAVGKQIGIRPGTISAVQMKINMAMYRGLIGGALDTPLKHMSQVRNTVTEVGYLKTAKGLLSMLTPKGREAFNKSGVLDEYNNVVERRATDLAMNKSVAVLDKVLFAPMKAAQYVNRGIAYHAGLAEAYSRGLDGPDSVVYAQHIVNTTQFRYGMTNTSPYLMNPLGKIAMQMSTYPLKELQFIKQTLAGPQAALKITRMLAFDGMILGLGAATGSDLKKWIGWDDVKGVPLPIGMAEHMANMASPTGKLVYHGLAAAGSPLTGKSYADLGGDLKNMVPGSRTAAKFSDMISELQTGMHYNKKGRPDYRMSPGDAGEQFIGIKPRVESKYAARHRGE